MTLPLKGLPEADFVAIESAVMATERGRCFLAEFARRRRVEDAQRILGALEKLEARAARVEVDRTRQRIESERAAEVVRQLADVLKDLRPLADARVRAKKMAARGGHEGRGDLEKRMAALVELDGDNIENEAKLFG